MRDLLKRLVDAGASEDPSEREKLIEKAEQELKSYVREHPEASRQVAAIATPPVPKATGRPVTKIQGIFDFLTYVFTIAEYLEQPVALPGFLTGSDDVAVIDVRPATRSATTFKPPRRSWDVRWPGTKDPQIWMVPGEALLLDIPRVWLIEDGVALRIGQINSELSPTDPSPRTLEDKFKNEWRVSTISPHDVTLVKRFDSQANQARAIAGPEGVVVLRDALLRAVKAKGEENERWLDALTVPTPP